MAADPVDQLLGWLRSASSEIGARLVDIENDTTRHMLDQAELRGASATQWATARRTILDLWRWYGTLTSLIARADHLRGPKPGIPPSAASQLHLLLTGPSIEPDVADRVAPADLVGRMSHSLSDVEDLLGRIARAWDESVRRLREIRAAMADAQASATELGATDEPDVADLRVRLDALAQALLVDPLSVESDDFEAADSVLTRLRSDLAAAADLRNASDERMADARAMLDRLARTVDQVDAAHREVTAKIVGPKLPRPADDRQGLGRRLGSIAEQCRGGDWRTSSRLLTEWHDEAAERLADAEKQLAHIRVPMEHRNELRSRLDAYRVKAARLDLIEDPEVADAYDRASSVLYTAPTDLSLAAELVARYRRLLDTVHGGISS